MVLIELRLGIRGKWAASLGARRVADHLAGVRYSALDTLENAVDAVIASKQLLHPRLYSLGLQTWHYSLDSLCIEFRPIGTRIRHCSTISEKLCNAEWPPNRN